MTSSMWNGKYGDTERARRDEYDRVAGAAPSIVPPMKPGKGVIPRLPESKTGSIAPAASTYGTPKPIGPMPQGD